MSAASSISFIRLSDKSVIYSSIPVILLTDKSVVYSSIPVILLSDKSVIYSLIATIRLLLISVISCSRAGILLLLISVLSCSIPVILFVLHPRGHGSACRASDAIRSGTRYAKWAGGSRSQTHRRAAMCGFTQDDGYVQGVAPMHYARPPRILLELLFSSVWPNPNSSL